MAIRKFILRFSIIGTLFFSIAFIFSYISPSLIESTSKTLIRHEVEKRVSAKLESMRGGKVGKVLEHVTKAHFDEIAKVKTEFAELIPLVITQMNDPDCECRNIIQPRVSNQVDSKSSWVGDIRERGEILIRTKYLEIVDALLREFRIFTGANAIVFALLGLTTHLRKNSGLQLILPVIVLAGSGIVVGGLYIFGQDWLHTIIFSDYVGFGYFTYLSIAIGFMTDVLYNRGRVSLQILDAVGNAGGSIS